MIHVCLDELDQYTLNTAVVGSADIICHPIFAQKMFGHFNHDVVRLGLDVVAIAVQTLQTDMKNDAKNERIYYNMALLFDEMNKISEADKAFAKAVELKSMNPKVYYNYGLLLNQNKKYKEAEKVLLKGLTLNPSDGELYYALTFVYIQTNNKGKAQETGLKLKQLEPNNPNYQQLFASLGI